MRRWIVMLAFALGCEAEGSWFGQSSYVLESIEGRELAPGSRISLRFYGHELEAYPGCLAMYGEYHRTAGAIVIDGALWESEIAISCGDATHEQEAWMESFLYGSPAYEIDGPRFTLSDDVVTLVLLDEEIANPDRPLVGTVWAIDGLVSDGFVMGVEGGALTFGADGRLAIDGPCASGTADYVSDDHFVTLGDVAIDPPQCPGDETPRRHTKSTGRSSSSLTPS